MAGRETADIVFCVDASGSMRPCIDGVRNNVVKLLDTLNKTGLQMAWDVRFDFLAYSNRCSEMRLLTLNNCGKDVIDGLYNNKVKDANGVFLKKIFTGSQNGSVEEGETTATEFFTKDLEKFKTKLDAVKCYADEATVLALDICADFPFRDAKTCHRVVILLTDEPVADGKFVSVSREKLMKVAQKYQEKKIMLFMVTPDCPSFDTLSQIDKCEWMVDNSAGLNGIDFRKLMQSIGKSVSISQSNGSGKDDPSPLFNENAWKDAENNLKDASFLNESVLHREGYVKCVGLDWL